MKKSRDNPDQSATGKKHESGRVYNNSTATGISLSARTRRNEPENEAEIRGLPRPPRRILPATAEFLKETMPGVFEEAIRRGIIEVL